jgi:signal transduction histidine kinase
MKIGRGAVDSSGRSLSQAGRRSSRLMSPARTAAVSIAVIAAAEIVAMLILDAVRAPRFWPATLLDAAIMVALILPALTVLLFRPMFRMFEERRDAEERLEKRAQELEALAAENAGLLRAEKRAREQAETLRSASLAIACSLDPEAIFSALLDNLGRIVPYDRAKVILLEIESRLQVRAVFSATGELDFPDKPFDVFEARSNAAVQEVLASQRSVCIADTSLQPGWGAGARGEAERSWLGVPLRAGGKAIGLFTLVKAEPGFFTPDRVGLIEALSAPASVALANSRLFEEVRNGRERLQSLSRKLVDGQEKERRKVARELHDEAGQLLASLTVGLRLVEQEVERPEAVLAHAAELRRIAQAAQEGLHRLASDLRPAALDHLGLIPALGQLAAKIQRRDGRSGPEIHLETTGFDGRRLSPEIEIAFFRIAQEALTNALRHSGARRISLVLRRKDSRILMVLEDDGCGFDPKTVSPSERLGLPGIRERAELLGGTLLVESRPGSGTTLVVEAPDAD